MNASQAALRRAALRSRAHNSVITTNRQWARYASDAPQAPRRKGGKYIGFAAIFGVAGAGAYYYPKLKEQFAPEPEEQLPKKAELEFEKPRKKVETKEEYRDLISSQHLQLKNAYEHPGVYAWGANSGKVIDPNSNEKYIKLPRRIAYFNDQLLRDLKLTQNFGAAVTENGDLVQWGLGYSRSDPLPVVTLKGKDLVKIDVSLDRIIALSRNGKVFSIPSSREDQEGGLKEEQPKSSWSIWGGSSGKENIHFRNLTPSTLVRGESVVDISSGQEHCLLLTNKGRVFSAAASALEFPSKGQMGIPGLSWTNRPKGPYDQAHEIMTLRGFDVRTIATGDFHSVVLDKTGRVFTFGDNANGQLGFESDYGLQSLDAPSMIAVNKLYGTSGLVPTVTSIAAGGLNTFFTVDAKAPERHESLKELAPAKRLPPISADLWSCGNGVYGTLGTGRWAHVVSKPAKVKSLSSLFEFDEKTNKMIPIRLKTLSIGASHCSVIMDNVTETSITGKGTENETNWGADVMLWGGNEHYQLGTGKRMNLNTPAYIGALDGEPKSDFHRLCIAPRKTVRLGEGGKGRKVTMEQKLECGRFVTGVYSAL